jgi:hypothetical protein
VRVQYSVSSVYYQPNSSRRGGPLSRPPAGCAVGSVGNPFDRVWPPTTSGYLQPIFSCVDSRGTQSLARGWGLLVTDRCVLNHHNRTGSFKMKRFEIFCSDPFTLGNGQRDDASRASLDVAVRAGTEKTTPRGLVAAVSGFGGPCTLPL